MATSKGRSNVQRCSFCGRDQNEIRRLIAGPDGVFICDECVGLCQEVLEEDGILNAAGPQAEPRPEWNLIPPKEILRLREELNQIISHHTGQPIERIAEDTERDRYMTAVQAKEYGLIDEVLSPMMVKEGKGGDK